MTEGARSMDIIRETRAAWGMVLKAESRLQGVSFVSASQPGRTGGRSGCKLSPVERAALRREKALALFAMAFSRYGDLYRAACRYIEGCFEDDFEARHLLMMIVDGRQLKDILKDCEISARYYYRLKAEYLQQLDDYIIGLSAAGKSVATN